MKRLIALTFVAVFVAGCAGDPAKEQAGAAVEERTPGSGKAAGTTTPEKAPGVETRPLGEQAMGMDPLKDPKSPLSARSVFYEFDSYVVKEEYKPLVQAHAKYLRDNPKHSVILQGNADERGSREYNLALGQRRSESVKKMMELLGVPDGQLEAVSFGEEKPRCQDHTEDCWGQNRRTDIVYRGE